MPLPGPLRLLRNIGAIVSNLQEKYFRQQEVDALLMTTANESSAVVFKYFKSKLVPQAQYNEVLFLVFNSWRFLRAVFLKCRFPVAIASGVALFLTPLFKNYYHSETKGNMFSPPRSVA